MSDSAEVDVTGPIVVGVDGSEASERALIWAAEYAIAAGVQLRVVLARVHPVPITAVAPEPVWPWPVVHQRDEVAVGETAHLLETAVRAALPSDDRLDLEIEVIDGDAASGLMDSARDSGASLLVTGRRGRGGFKRLLLGSVSDECATYAPCSVAVVSKPASWAPEPVVLVGADGSDASNRAIDWAGRWAQMRRARLDIIHAWEQPKVPSDSLAGALPWLHDNGGGLADLAESTLKGSVSYAREQFPEVVVNGEVLEGYPSEVLARAARSRRVALLVLGTRGLGGFTSMLLGSVAHQCLHHAVYPVVVVRSSM